MMDLTEMGPDLSGGLESLARLELPSSVNGQFSSHGNSQFSPSNGQFNSSAGDQFSSSAADQFSPGAITGIQPQPVTGRKSEVHKTISSPGHQIQLLKAAHSFCESQEYVDLTIQCEDGQLHAHQLMLAVASPFLKQLFQSERERLGPGCPVVLVLPEVRSSLVQALLHFLYNGTVVTQEGQFYSLMKLVYALNINASIEAESTQSQPTTFRTAVLPFKEEDNGVSASKRRKRDSDNNLVSSGRQPLAVNSFTASGVMVKEELEEKPQVHESFNLSEGVMASGVTGPGTNQANNNQLGHFVNVSPGYQIKMELPGSCLSSLPTTSAIANPTPTQTRSSQPNATSDSSGSDDPLAAIMNQTIFGGDSMNTMFIQVSTDHFMAPSKQPKSPAENQAPGTPSPEDDTSRLTDVEELPCVPDDDDLNISYNCETCNRSIKGKVMMQAHKFQEHHENPDFEASNFPDDKFACRVCLKLFTRNSDVKAHILRVHCGDRRYPCTMCGKRFKESTHLRKHLYTHTGERPHYCTLCSKGFQTSSDLKRHKKTRVHQERVEQGNAAAAPGDSASGIDFNTDIDLDQELDNSSAASGGTAAPPTTHFQSSPSFSSANHAFSSSPTVTSTFSSATSSSFSQSPQVTALWDDEAGSVSNLMVSGQTMTLHSGSTGGSGGTGLNVQHCSLPSSTLDLSDIKWGILESSPLKQGPATGSPGPEEERLTIQEDME